jgi:hypothetical protein
VLTHLAAEVVTPHLDPSSAGTDECRPNGGVEGDVMVAGPREPVPCVLAATATDERPRPPTETRALEAVDSAAMLEDALRVDADGLDPRRAVRDGVDVER